jgi:threonine/homoserine/homoserine lactone efflux protein
LIVATIIGIMLGVLLAVPPGPLGMTAVKIGLEEKRASAFKFAIGGGVADMLLCLIAIMAASALEGVLSELLESHPYYYLFFQVIVIFLLALFGLLLIDRKNQCLNGINHRPTRSSKLMTKLMQKGAFFFGLALALTNLANPSFLPSLMFISVNLYKFNVIENTFLINVVFAVSFGFGNFIWLNILSSTVRKYQHRLSPNFIVRVNQFAGLTFLSFAGIIGFRMVLLTKWAELLRFAF